MTSVGVVALTGVDHRRAVVDTGRRVRPRRRQEHLSSHVATSDVRWNERKSATTEIGDRGGEAIGLGDRPAGHVAAVRKPGDAEPGRIGDALGDAQSTPASRSPKSMPPGSPMTASAKAWPRPWQPRGFGWRTA